MTGCKKTGEKTVSVIIPAYNSANFLRDAIDSVFQQSYDCFETIVIDDGSTDRTPEVISDYGERVTYVRQDNRGPAAARNAGLKLARGEFIAFLDADDIWLPSKTEEQMTVFDSEPDTALVFSRMTVFENGSDRNSSAIWPKKVYSGNVFNKLLVEDFIPLPTVIVRSAVLKKIGGFNERLSTGEDRNLWLKIAKDYKMSAIDKPLIQRRKHSQNLSDRADVQIGTLDGLDEIRILYPEIDSQYPEFVKAAYANRGKVLIEFYFNTSEYGKCHSVCRRVRVVAPADVRALCYQMITLLPAGVLDALRKLRRAGLARLRPAESDNRGCLP